jgi:hypothetical protein
MKRSIIVALGAVVVVATVAAANMTREEATALCLEEGLLNQRQVNAGWYCEAEVENVSRLIGGGRNCQDAEQVTLQAYNPAGNPAEDKAIELQEGAWGPAYDPPCTF